MRVAEPEMEEHCVVVAAVARTGSVPTCRTQLCSIGLAATDLDQETRQATSTRSASPAAVVLFGAFGSNVLFTTDLQDSHARRPPLSPPAHSFPLEFGAELPLRPFILPELSATPSLPHFSSELAWYQCSRFRFTVVRSCMLRLAAGPSLAVERVASTAPIPQEYAFCAAVPNEGYECSLE
jgi:hypothetical protein